MSHFDCHSEQSEESLIDLIGQPAIQRPEMFRFAQHDRRTMVHFFS
jgi:hypothetical protein